MEIFRWWVNITLNIAGLFSLLFLLPACVQFGCYVYEYLHMDAWMASWQERACRDPILRSVWQMPCRQPGEVHQVQDWPGIWLYFIKFGSISLTAALSGTWVWCRKTLDTWRQVISRLHGNTNIYDTPHNLWVLYFSVHRNKWYISF